MIHNQNCLGQWSFQNPKNQISGLSPIPTITNENLTPFFQVYHAELMRGAGNVWHKECYKCKVCNTGLDSTKLNEQDGEIYCNDCYGKKFGPAGFGLGLQSRRHF